MQYRPHKHEASNIKDVLFRVDLSNTSAKMK
jgi:hypothetical protein